MSKEQDDPDRQSDGHEWFRDNLGPDLVQWHRVVGRVYSGRTRFQAVDVIETGSFGRCLVLDGRIQSSQGDEFIYHEALVQPAMVSHPGPCEVLIAGGGEGATLRQALWHPGVTSVVMVDIDAQVIELCKEHLASWHGGAFTDSRAEVVIADARKYIEESGRKFDVIVLDLPESLAAGPACLLYTREFYAAVRRALKPGGVVASQCDNASWGALLAFPAIINTLKCVFPVVRPYLAHMPSFGGSWGFAVASEDVDPLALAPEEVDCRLAERRLSSLRFYDGTTHRHMLSLPGHIRRRLAEETRLITDSSPLFI